MWWLSFRGGCAAIIKASSLAHARILATLNDPGQVSRFLKAILSVPTKRH